MSLSSFPHDLGLALAFDDLEKLSLQPLDADNVHTAFDFSVERRAGQRMQVDSAGGIELSLIPCQRIRHTRLLHRYRGTTPFAAYARWRQLKYGDADRLSDAADLRYDSEHAQRIIGGRRQAHLRIAPDSHRALRVTQAGGRGFAFADEIDGPARACSSTSGTHPRATASSSASSRTPSSSRPRAGSRRAASAHPVTSAGAAVTR